MHELSTEPKTRIEKADLNAITDPRQSKSLATNQAVRFHVDKETKQLRTDFTKSLEQLAEVFRAQLENTRTGYMKGLKDLGSIHSARIRELETRWWERLWRDLLADCSVIRSRFKSR